MKKTEIISKIIESEKLNEIEKVHTIKAFLLGWLEENDLTWIWEKEEVV